VPAVWVVGAALAAFAHPPLFDWFRTSQITNGLVFVMVGMGLTLTFSQIGGVFTRQPGLLALGMLLQYTLLPAIGYAISRCACERGGGWVGGRRVSAGCIASSRTFLMVNPTTQ
jgi:predicted Na+-dependent transporter